MYLSTFRFLRSVRLASLPPRKFFKAASEGNETTDEETKMKVMIRKDRNGNVSAYVPKKDMESEIVAMSKPGMWGGEVTLANGWKLELPEMANDTHMPITVEAKKLGGE
jgi:nitrogen fixation protein NifT